MPSEIVKKCSKLLYEQGLSIAFAESATAGRVIAEFALLPNCGKILTGSLVCYNADIKKDHLNVSDELVEQYTPESAEVTEAMAKGLKDFIPSDIQVATTGLTMPGGSETEEKPVGTMFVHVVFKGKHIPIRQVFEGGHEAIVLQTVDLVAQAVANEIINSQ
ncbi:CinA family protein [Mucilaginibacter koreensis]